MHRFEYCFMEPSKLIRAWLAHEAQRRGAKKVPYRVIAERGGFDEVYLTRYLRGHNEPKEETLEKIAAGFGVTYAEFMQGPPDTGRTKPLHDNETVQQSDPTATEREEWIIRGEMMGLLAAMTREQLRCAISFIRFLSINPGEATRMESQAENRGATNMETTDG